MDQQKKATLILGLRGKALEIVSTLPNNNQKDCDTIVLASKFIYGCRYLKQVYEN